MVRSVYSSMGIFNAMKSRSVQQNPVQTDLAKQQVSFGTGTEIVTKPHRHPTLDDYRRPYNTDGDKLVETALPNGKANNGQQAAATYDPTYFLRGLQAKDQPKVDSEQQTDGKPEETNGHSGITDAVTPDKKIKFSEDEEKIIADGNGYVQPGLVASVSKPVEIKKKVNQVEILCSPEVEEQIKASLKRFRPQLDVDRFFTQLKNTLGKSISGAEQSVSNAKINAKLKNMFTSGEEGKIKTKLNDVYPGLGSDEFFPTLKAGFEEHIAKTNQSIIETERNEDVKSGKIKLSYEGDRVYTSYESPDGVVIDLSTNMHLNDSTVSRGVHCLDLVGVNSVPNITHILNFLIYKANIIAPGSDTVKILSTAQEKYTRQNPPDQIFVRVKKEKRKAG